MSMVSRFCTRMLSKAVNAVRLAGLPLHRRNVRQSQRVLCVIRRFGDAAIAARCLAYLRQVDPLVFEEVILSALEDTGLLVIRNRRYTGDGGVDGAAWGPDVGWLAVQAKRYRGHVCREHVREFGNKIAQMHFDGGVFVHTGGSGAGIYDFLREDGIILLSGDRLVTLLLQRKLMRRRNE